MVSNDLLRAVFLPVKFHQATRTIMVSDSVTFRAAEVRDLPGILELIQPFVVARQLLPRTKVELEKLFEHGFVAECNQELVAFCAIEIYSTKLAEIQCLAVAPSHRNQGIGKNLIERCISCARQEGVCELMAITASENVFQQCGFDYALPDQKRALFIRLDDR